MGLTLNRKLKTHGVLGEDLFPRGGKLRQPQFLDLLQNTHHGFDQFGRRWWPIAVGAPVTNDPTSPPSLPGPTWYGPALTQTNTSFTRRLWTKIALAPLRQRIQLYLLFESGQMRFRYRTHHLTTPGAWSAYTTSPVHGAWSSVGYTLWAPTGLVLAAGGEYQFEFDLLASSGLTATVIAVVAVEEDSQTGDL